MGCSGKTVCLPVQRYELTNFRTTMTVTPVAYVPPIREISILFPTIAGIRRLRVNCATKRLVASASVSLTTGNLSLLWRLAASSGIFSISDNSNILAIIEPASDGNDRQKTKDCNSRRAT